MAQISLLASSAASRRKDLMSSAKRKEKWRKALVVTAGLLSLLSAGAVATALSNVLPKTGMQLIAAVVAGVSGAISLFSTSYFSENEIHTMYAGASKYLSLRDSANRLNIGPEVTVLKLLTQLTELQKEYVKLDETYARFFSRTGHDSYLEMYRSTLKRGTYAEEITSLGVTENSDQEQ